MKLIVRRDEYEKKKAKYVCMLNFYIDGYLTFSVHEDWFEDDMLHLGKTVDLLGEVELHLVWPEDLAVEE